jgi:outer membrane protein assembly factor BamD
VAALALPLLTTGCGVFKGLFGSSGETIEVPPQQLAEEGMQAIADERYQLAAQKFQDLKDRYPYSRYAILAELKLADARYFRGDYIEAADAYAEFERLHPKNEAVPYVIYQQGMSFFKQMTTLDREQSVTVKAIQLFTRLRQTYPESPYSSMAAARLTEAQNNLAGHEFYVGEFYYKMEAFQAALGRFRSLIENYPDTGYHTRAMGYISLCQQKLAELEARQQAKNDQNSK